MITENKAKSIDRLPSLDYSADEVMAKKQICYTAVLSLLEPESLTVGCAPNGTYLSIDRLCAEQRQEISNHLHSYTEVPLMCEIEDRIWVIIPSFYPSSTLFVALVFDDGQLSVSEVLRLAQDERAGDLFKFSKYIKSSPCRSSDRLSPKGELFFKLCDEIKAAFFDINKMPGMVGEDKCRDEIIAQILRISQFVGAPITELNEILNENYRYSQTDYPLLTAYLLTFMMLAKNVAYTRDLRVSLSSAVGAALVRLSFDTDEALGMSSAILTWEDITYEKNMLFEYAQHDDTVRVGFQPMRYDWSYLGLKQGNEFDKLK